MHIVDTSVVLSPSDLTGFLDCHHLSQLDLKVANSELDAPPLEDPELVVVRGRGKEHEINLLANFKTAGRSVAEISSRGGSLEAYREAQEHTLSAMRAGVEVIYQGVLFNGRWLGYADFLEKVPRPSALGEYSYEVLDAKLARRAKTAALVQTTLYSWLLEPLQGIAPQQMRLILGDGSQHIFRVADYSSYVALARQRLEDALADKVHTYPEPVEHCGICRWRGTCRQQWISDDHLSLVAFMRRDQANRLRVVGITTMAKLASAPDDLQVPHMPDGPLARLRLQARLQVEGRKTGRVIYDLLPPTELGPGLGALPEPVIGDFFFDMEGDPYVDGGLEYLFGLTELTSTGPVYRAFWAHDRREEKEAFEAVIDLVMDRLETNPKLHIYHYASYEPSALKRLMGQHATRESEVDRLLRGAVLVDLYQVVRRTLRISQDSYSLKSVELFYMARRKGLIHDAGSSIVAYETWLEERQSEILDDLQRYNESDCLSTLYLRDWLESLRAEYERRYQTSLSRLPSAEPEAEVEQADRERQTAILSDALTAGADSSVERTAEQTACWLLGQSLWFHRREAKSQWWAYFQRIGMTGAELVEDPEALGGLVYDGEAGRVLRSVIHRYRYLQQEHKILRGSIPLDPRTDKPAGVVEEVDPVECMIYLRRGLGSHAPHPTDLIPGKPYNDLPLRDAIRNVAEWVVDNGIDAPGPYRAIRDLLLRRPRLPGVAAADVNDAAVEMVGELERTCLGIQGPPGSGKTRTGAQMVVRLIKAKKQVGLTALSHSVISHFLEEVAAEARRQSVTIQMFQKAEQDDSSHLSEVTRCSSNTQVIAALTSHAADVVAGTAWLFADPGMHGLVDTLFVDEAGQVPLANVIAAAGATDNIVLLGDPNQLSQPIHGAHPEYAAVSALQHLLGEDVTMPAERGLFLNRSWRMHPEICHFISEIAYDGRLEPRPGCELQAAAGMRAIEFTSVVHSGNRTSSVEEADAVRALVDSLIGRNKTNRDGKSEAIGLDDILIVAPYNSQVGLIGRNIRGAHVGTVDKFQGQEAAVAIYSMSTSSPDEVPHGIDFLYSLNRLNVAVSRAQALAVVICSPKLLLLHPHTPEQMRLANALCRLAEMHQQR